jgi:hypothetical protein
VTSAIDWRYWTGHLMCDYRFLYVLEALRDSWSLFPLLTVKTSLSPMCSSIEFVSKKPFVATSVVDSSSLRLKGH